MSRVLLLLTAPAWRGSGISFAKIAGALQPAHQVTALVASESVAIGLREAGVHQIVRRDLTHSGGASLRVLRALRGDAPWDLVIADAPRDVRLAAGAGLGPIAWRFNLPNRPVPGDLWSRWLFRRVHRLIYQSRFAESLVRDGAPWLYRRGGTLIPNGFDAARLAPDAARGAAWRQARGIPASAPLVMTIGALSPEKALPATLAIGTRVAGAVPGTQQVLIGAGEDAADLAGQAGPHVHLLGELGPAETHDALRAADVVLQLSPRETFSNVTAEAMAIGAAVVGADSGGIAEVLGPAGVTVGADDTVAAANAAIDLLQDISRRRTLGDAARARIVHVYPLAQMTAGYGALVDQMTRRETP